MLHKLRSPSQAIDIVRVIRGELKWSFVCVVYGVLGFGLRLRIDDVIFSVMPKTSSSTLSPHEILRVAVEASLDPRTVKAFLDGRAQASTTRHRVAKALDALGLGARAKMAMRESGARDRLAGDGTPRVSVGAEQSEIGGISGFLSTLEPGSTRGATELYEAFLIARGAGAAPSQRAFGLAVMATGLVSRGQTARGRTYTRLYRPGELAAAEERVAATPHGPERDRLKRELAGARLATG